MPSSVFSNLLGRLRDICRRYREGAEANSPNHSFIDPFLEDEDYEPPSSSSSESVDWWDHDRRSNMSSGDMSDAVATDVRTGEQVRPQQDQSALPSVNDTRQALEAIEPGRNEQASQGLRELALAVIRAVTEVDRNLNVGRFLKALTIVCNGPGDFRLDILDVNSDIDPEDLAKQIAEQMEEEGGLLYGRQLRPIQVDFGDEENAEATRPDGALAEDVQEGTVGGGS